MPEIELEKTYLVKFLPDDLFNYPQKQIQDLFVPASSTHAKLRIRKNGDWYTITKKVMLDANDASQQEEHTIPITKEEFGAFLAIQARTLKKIRFSYQYQDLPCEIDVFTNELEGLALADFEFNSLDEMRRFKDPEFCLADVTQEDFIAGGVLAGKKYSDIQPLLEKFGYSKLLLKDPIKYSRT